MQNNATNITNSQPAKSQTITQPHTFPYAENVRKGIGVVRIYLIGYMGVGKTTVGKKLAHLLDMNFIDLDKFIESKYHKTVSELFAEKGEPEFRLIEQKSLREVSEIEDVVVSTGGGAPCFFDNMQLMNQSGVTVYIKADAEELAARLRASKTVRPIVAGKSFEELKPFITRHLSDREPFYNQAKIVYQTDRLVTKEHVHLTVDGIAGEIRKIQKK